MERLEKLSPKGRLFLFLFLSRILLLLDQKSLHMRSRQPKCVSGKVQSTLLSCAAKVKTTLQVSELPLLCVLVITYISIDTGSVKYFFIGDES